MEMKQAINDAVIGLALIDKAFRARLLADPAAALEQLGIALPVGVSLTVVEETASRRYLVLPAKPPTDQVPDTDLAGVSGGGQIGGTVGNIPGTFLPFHVDGPEDGKDVKQWLDRLNQRWKAR